jgi:hypothetical protein
MPRLLGSHFVHVILKEAANIFWDQDSKTWKFKPWPCNVGWNGSSIYVEIKWEPMSTLLCANSSPAVLQDWVPYSHKKKSDQKALRITKVFCLVWMATNVTVCCEALISDPIFGPNKCFIYPTPPARRSPTATATLPRLAVLWVKRS